MYQRVIGERRDATLKLWWSQLHGEARHAARERLRAATKLTFEPKKDPTPEVIRAAQRVLTVLRPQEGEPRIARIEGAAMVRRARKRRNRAERRAMVIQHQPAAGQ